MKDNRGFTLIELIISIAIVAMLLGGVAMSMDLLVLADTKSCAEKINVTLSQLRLETMSKGSMNHYMIIEWNDSDSCYYLNAVTSTIPLDETNWKTEAVTIKAKKIANSKITISYTDQLDGSNIRIIDASNPCKIVNFQTGSGAFKSSWRQIIVASRADTLTVCMVLKSGKHYIV